MKPSLVHISAIYKQSDNIFIRTCFLPGVLHLDDPTFGHCCHCGSFYVLVSLPKSRQTNCRYSLFVFVAVNLENFFFYKWSIERLHSDQPRVVLGLIVSHTWRSTKFFKNEALLYQTFLTVFILFDSVVFFVTYLVLSCCSAPR